MVASCYAQWIWFILGCFRQERERKREEERYHVKEKERKMNK